MALQKINWTQIDTPFVPSGSTVDLGSMSTPLDGVYVETLFIADENAPHELHNFFWYLTSGYTPGTGQTIDTTYIAFLTGTNIFHGSQIINNTTGNSITARRNIVVSGTTVNVSLNRTGNVSVSGTTGESVLGQGYLTLIGPNDGGGIPSISLSSNDPTRPGRLFIALNANENEINPVSGPAITQLGPDNNYYTIIGFQPITGWTNGDVTFYTPVHFATGVTITGNIDITGQYLINGVPFTGFTPVNITVVDNGGLSITTGGTMSTVYNTALDSTLAVPTTVGGITAGTTAGSLTGKTLVQIVDDLLFPTVLPTYTIPTITLPGISTQTYEAGRTFSATLSPYGIKNDAGPFTQLRILRDSVVRWTDPHLSAVPETNIPAQFGYTDPNNPNYRYVTDEPPYVETYVIPRPTGLNTYTTTDYWADGNYQSGLPKQNNKGGYDTRTPAVRSTSAPQLSGNTFISSVYTITGIHPYFYGVSGSLPTVHSIASAISGGTATKVLTQASGTLSIPYNVTAQYIWFAYFTNYTTKTKWYVNALDNGDIDGSFISTAATEAVNSPDGYWSGITFKMHWSVYPTNQETIEFRNS